MFAEPPIEATQNFDKHAEKNTTHSFLVYAIFLNSAMTIGTHSIDRPYINFCNFLRSKPKYLSKQKLFTLKFDYPIELYSKQWVRDI
jgi:hypothetical protein